MPVQMTVKAAPHGTAVKLWTDTARSEALEQLKNVARLPITYSHIAPMPDVHYGRGGDHRKRDHNAGGDHSHRGRGRHRVRHARGATGPRGRPAAGQPAAHAGCNRSAGTGRLRAAAEQTTGIECHKDADLIDDIPGAHQPIDDVMEHENDLAVPVHRLRQVLNIKG